MLIFMSLSLFMFMFILLSDFVMLISTDNFLHMDMHMKTGTANLINIFFLLDR